MPGIEYQPSGLEQTLQHPYIRRRLKGRDGLLTLQDEHGDVVGTREDGSILELHDEAKRYVEENPHHTALLREQGCSLLGSLNTSPTK